VTPFVPAEPTSQKPAARMHGLERPVPPILPHKAVTASGRHHLTTDQVQATKTQASGIVSTPCQPVGRDAR
jgi:hypothetical protein